MAYRTQKFNLRNIYLFSKAAAFTNCHAKSMLSYRAKECVTFYCHGVPGPQFHIMIYKFFKSRKGK
jgi:hypothetical protein